MTTDARALAFGTCSVTAHAASSQLAAHAHPTASLCLVVDGGFDEGFGRRTIACAPASALWRNPGVEHIDRFGPSGARCFNVEIDPSWLPARVDDVVDQSRAGPLTWAAARALAAFDDDALILDSAVAEIVAAACSGVAHAGERNAHTVARAIDDDPAAPWSLAALAREVDLHPIHLARVFRRAHGESVGERVRRRRVEAAARALARGEPISDVALDVGFADQAHLTRAFKRVSGFTPARFRSALRSFKTRPARSAPLRGCTPP